MIDILIPIVLFLVAMRMIAAVLELLIVLDKRNKHDNIAKGMTQAGREAYLYREVYFYVRNGIAYGEKNSHTAYQVRL